jgi:hypothetical protein
VSKAIDTTADKVGSDVKNTVSAASSAVDAAQKVASSVADKAGSDAKAAKNAIDSVLSEGQLDSKGINVKQLSDKVQTVADEAKKAVADGKATVDDSDTIRYPLPESFDKFRDTVTDPRDDDEAASAVTKLAQDAKGKTDSSDSGNDSTTVAKTNNDQSSTEVSEGSSNLPGLAALGGLAALALVGASVLASSDDANSATGSSSPSSTPASKGSSPSTSSAASPPKKASSAQSSTASKSTTTTTLPTASPPANGIPAASSKTSKSFLPKAQPGSKPKASTGMAGPASYLEGLSGTSPSSQPSVARGATTSSPSTATSSIKTSSPPSSSPVSKSTPARPAENKVVVSPGMSYLESLNKKNT